jgi:hypothetical protein
MNYKQMLMHFLRIPISQALANSTKGMSISKALKYALIFFKERKEYIISNRYFPLQICIYVPLVHLGK